MAERQSPRVPCTVSAGLFSSEREIEVKLPDGKVFSAPVDRTRVFYEGRLGKNQIRDGHVSVRVVEYTPTTVFIDLPGQDVMLGSRVEVPIDFLERSDSNPTQS